jgi:hypothetical protein
MKTRLSLVAASTLAFGCAEAPLPMGSLASMESVRLCWRANASINPKIARDHAIVELVARGWTPEEVEAASVRRVFIGMNREAVFCAWGKPTTIDTSTTAEGWTEQFAYRDGISTRYVYIADGVVASISN